MKKAFTYIFDDNKIIPKFTLLSIFVFISLIVSVYTPLEYKNCLFLGWQNYLILSILGCLIFLLIEGYKLSIIKALTTTKECKILPLLNLKKSLILGVKYIIAQVLFFIPTFCLILVFGTIVGFTNVIPLGVINFISLVLLLLILVLYGLYMLYFTPAIVHIFLENTNCLAFYKFEEIFSIAFKEKKKYLACVGLNFVCAILIEEIYRITFMVFNNINQFSIILLFMFAVIVTYLLLVKSYIIASAGKK